MGLMPNDRNLEVGTTVRLSTTLKVEKTLVDAATIQVILKRPDGTTTHPVVVREGVGTFHADVVPNLHGQWKYRWESTDPISAEEGSFIVRKSQVI